MLQEFQLKGCDLINDVVLKGGVSPRVSKSTQVLSSKGSSMTQRQVAAH